jgi:hydrogenase 3 maturation protease
LRGDDAAGLIAAGLIRKACRCRSVRVFIGGTAPENFTGEIIRFAPLLVVIIDAAHMGLRPGAVRLIPRDRTGGFSFSTHTMPLGVLARYLECSTGCDVILVGIQPATIEWGAPVTAAVKTAAARVADEICACIRKRRHDDCRQLRRGGAGSH